MSKEIIEEKFWHEINNNKKHSFYLASYKELFILQLWAWFNKKRWIAYMNAVVLGKHHWAAYNDAKKSNTNQTT